MNDYKHEHKFFGFQTRKEFEPVIVDGVTYYQPVDYLISGCSCGESRKSVARTVEGGEDE